MKTFSLQPLRSNFRNVGFFENTKLLRKCDIMDNVKTERAKADRTAMVDDFRSSLKTAAEHVAEKRGLKITGTRVARVKRDGKGHHIAGFGTREDLTSFDMVKNFLRENGFTGVRRGAVVIKLA